MKDSALSTVEASIADARGARVRRALAMGEGETEDQRQRRDDFEKAMLAKACELVERPPK